MKPNRGYVVLEKLQATRAGNIETIVADIDLDNGSFVAIGGLAGMGGEVVKAEAPTDVTTQEVLLVASPEVVYDVKESIYDFYNPAGKPTRAFHLYAGDIIGVSSNMIDGEAVKDQFLIPKNGQVKLTPAENLEGGTRFAAQVIATEKQMGVDMVVFRVLKS